MSDETRIALTRSSGPLDGAAGVVTAHPGRGAEGPGVVVDRARRPVPALQRRGGRDRLERRAGGTGAVDRPVDQRVVVGLG